MAVVGGGPAQANLFEIEPAKASTSTSIGVVARTRVLVIVFGPARGNVTVALRGQPAYAGATLFHPGMNATRLPAPLPTKGELSTMSVPLSHGDPHGCAVVRLTPAADKSISGST